jgi:hypothetical protein
VSCGRCNSAVVDTVEARAFTQSRKGFDIGARHPRLASQRHDLVEQRGAAQRVQVGRDLIEEQDRRGTVAALAHEVGMRQHEPISSAFCSPVEHTLSASAGAVADEQVGTMWTFERAPSRPSRSRPLSSAST